MLCAQAHAGAGRIGQALEAASRADALQATPSPEQTKEMARLWLSIGMAAFLAESWNDALAALEKGAVHDPMNPDISLYLGMTLQSLQRLDEAVNRYRAVLETDEADTQTRLNLMFCCLSIGRLEEAADLLRNWPESQREIPEYDMAAAHILKAEGSLEEALEHLDSDVLFREKEISSELRARIHGIRGELLYSLGRTGEALEECEQAVRFAPGSSKAVGELGLLLWNLDRKEDAETLWRGFLDRHGPSPLIRTQRRLAIPSILTDKGHGERIRNGLRSFFQHEAPKMPVLGLPQALLGSPPFHLAFHGYDDRELLEEMAAFLLEHSGLGAFAATEQTPLASRSASMRPRGRRRIGFISRHFSHHTVMSYFFRLLTELCPRLPECVLLEFPQKDNLFRRELAAHARLVTLPENLFTAKEAIIALDLDILVHLDLGMDSLGWFLAFARLAPVQCALYGHPMTTGIPAVDFFLSPALMEPPGAERFYSEALHVLPCLLSAFLMPAAPRAVESSRRSFTSYLCPQSLFKVHPDMDDAVARILREDATARVRFFVSSRPGETSALQTRLRAVLGDEFERVDWLKQRSEEAFLAALLEADVVLDTPHFSGGATSYKALGVGVPVVTLEGAFMRGRQTAGLYRHMGVTGCTADSLDDWSRLAMNLAHSPDQRMLLRKTIGERNAVLFDAGPSVAALEAFLLGDMGQ
jgi:predicted O-linked N-acetylglucosamine transferase (SPINDLY family)